MGNMNNRMFPKMEKMQKLNIIIKCMTRGRKKGNAKKNKNAIQEC